MKLFYFFAASFFCTAALRAQTLVKDINTPLTATGYTSANITDMAVAGNNIFFAANDASSGIEPWITDGTAAGTHLLRDINPGKAGSAPREFTYCNGYVYFSANDGTHGSEELWRTDGTAEGTALVKDIAQAFSSLNAPDGSGVHDLCEVNGVLYFVAHQTQTGMDYGIWKTDGTDAGTVPVNNLSNAFNAGPSSLINFNGLLYFLEGGVIANSNLFRINSLGIAENVIPGVVASKLTIVGSTLYFAGTTTATGIELWKTDGITTTLVKDINPGTVNSTPDLLTAVNGTLFFTATDGVNGTELWKSDGTAGGTVMVKDITTADNTSGNRPTSLTNVNGTLFFAAYTVAANRELWKSDGTDAGTVLVKDISPGSSFPGGDPLDLINNNGQLLFRANNSEVWKSDGTTAGTVLVKQMNFCSGFTPLPTAPGNILYYGADVFPFTTNGELWKTDGTSGGTALLKNIATDNPASLYDYSGIGHVAERFAHANGRLFFSTRRSNSIFSMYSTFGTDPSTTQLTDYTGSGSPFPKDAVNAGGIVFFNAPSTTEGQELWKSDGTLAGTALVKDIRPGTAGSQPSDLININGTVFFAANDGTNGIELWKTDGTAAGTVLVKDINTGSVNSTPEQFINFNGTLFFTAFTAANGRELWKSDGTAAGTVMIKDIFSGVTSSLNTVGSSGVENYFTIMGNELFFTAIGSTTAGYELWKTDGTNAGTVLVKDIISTASQSSSPHLLTVAGNRLFFVADDYAFGVNDELWVSDGTSLGTVKLKEINAGNLPSSPSNLIARNGILYFSAYEPATGYELWKSDGTTGGTVLVKDIDPGPTSGMQAGQLTGANGIEAKNIIEVNGTLYFPAATAAAGKELWQSDGTAAGTMMVGDLFPGPQSSDPEQITNGNTDIYFVGDDGTSGKELYSFKPFVGYIAPPSNGSDSMDISKQNISLIDNTNQIIATIKQTGIKPINGFVKTRVTIEPAAINYNGRNLARRHTDIEPLTDASTSTATVTLYFSQADFDTYNTEDNLNGDLPANPADVLGKAALRIIQYHGVGTAPGNYPGAEEIINPADDSIVWNANNNYWEVSFTVTGFSGFYLSSAPAAPLPVRLVSFSGHLTTPGAITLEWKTAEQQGIIRYEIEKSATINGFKKTATVDANTQAVYTYRHEDIAPFNGKNYYRLKIIDRNGQISYSNTILVVSQNSTAIHMMQSQGYVILQTKENRYLGTVASVFDLSGRVMQQLTITQNSQYIDISRMAAGIYYLQLEDGTIMKFKK